MQKGAAGRGLLLLRQLLPGLLGLEKKPRVPGVRGALQRAGLLELMSGFPERNKPGRVCGFAACEGGDPKMSVLWLALKTKPKGNPRQKTPSEEKLLGSDGFLDSKLI